MSYSSEKDFIEFLIFQNRLYFLYSVIDSLSDHFGEYRVDTDKFDQLNLVDDKNNVLDINDLIDYCIDIELNDFGRECYSGYLGGAFFNEDEVGDIIENGLVFKIKMCG